MSSRSKDEDESGDRGECDAMVSISSSSVDDEWVRACSLFGMLIG